MMNNRQNSCYRGCNSNGGANQASLMRKIQEIDFSLYETVLYLDAYPRCRAALNYYHSLKKTRDALAAEYENAYGPITAFGNTSQGSWDWVNGPWPWHI